MVNYSSQFLLVKFIQLARGSQNSFVMCLFLPDTEYLSVNFFLADRQELRMSARNRSILIYSISGRSKHTTKLFHLTNVAQ